MLLSLDDSTATSFYPLNPEVEWVKLGFDVGLAYKIRRAWNLKKILIKNNIDVLVGFVIGGDMTIYVASKLAKVKLIAAERNAPEMYKFRCSALQRLRSFLLLHFANRITVQWSTFVTRYPISLRNRIYAIPNPVQLNSMLATPNVPNANGRFILLAVSRLDCLQKRIGCLIKAFAMVACKNPDWDLCIIGEGPDESSLRQIVESLCIGDRVKFKPATANVCDEYLKANLFGIPSLWEGFSNSLAESLSYGLPAVGFQDAAGVADLIEASGGGWLASGLSDDMAFASALNEAMSNHEERKRRGILAKSRMEAYAPETQFDQWAGLLRSVNA